MNDDNPGLKKTVTTPALFAIGFGHIIGIGWITVMGDWLENAGPLGAIMAVCSVGFAMCLIGVCYGAVATRIPRAGAEIAYAFKCFGELPAYLMGWILALYAVCVVGFLSISFSLFLKTLMPAIGDGVAYTLFGEPVTHMVVAASLIGSIILTIANLRGTQSVFQAQTVMTAFLMAVIGILFLASTVEGDVGNMRPLLSPKLHDGGFMTVVVMMPFFYGGFQIIPQMMEERDDSGGISAGTVIVAAILLAMLFYALVIIAVSLAAPYKVAIEADLATYEAIRQGLSTPFGEIVLVAGLLGILTSWNSAFVWGVRVLFALGRARFISLRFGRLSEKHQTPGAAILFVGGASVALSLAGPGFLVPLVTIASSLISLTMLVTCLCAWRIHGTPDEEGKITKVRGGRPLIAVAAALAAGLAVYSIVKPFLDANQDAAVTGWTIPVETFGLAAWLVVGIAWYSLTNKQRRTLSRSRRAAIIIGK